MVSLNRVLSLCLLALCIVVTASFAMLHLRTSVSELPNQSTLSRAHAANATANLSLMDHILKNLSERQYLLEAQMNAKDRLNELRRLESLV